MHAMHRPGTALLLERAVPEGVEIEGEVHQVEIFFDAVDFRNHGRGSGHGKGAVYEIFLQVDCKEDLSVRHDKDSFNSVNIMILFHAADAIYGMPSTLLNSPSIDRKPVNKLCRHDRCDHAGIVAMITFG